MQGGLRLPPGSQPRPFSLLSGHHVLASWGPSGPALRFKTTESHWKPLPFPVKLPGTRGQCLGVAWLWSTPALLASSARCLKGRGAGAHGARAGQAGGGWGCRQRCSQVARAFVRCRAVFNPPATRERGCGRQVKSCLDNADRKVSRMPK